MSSYKIPNAINKASPRKVLFFGSVTHIWSDLFFALLIPLLPYIKNDLNLTYTQLGLLRSIYSGSSAVLQIPAGFLAENTGEFWMIISGNMWVSLGLILMGIVPGFYSLLTASALGGLGGGTQHPLASSMVSRAYETTGRSSAVGTVNFAGDIGKMFAPIVAAFFIFLSGWRMALWAVGISGAVFMCIFVTFRRSFQPDKPDKINIQKIGNPEEVHEKENISGFVLLTCLGILDSAVRNATLILFPFILLERGMGEDQLVVALFLLFAGGASGKYICGWMNDRTGTISLIWLTKGGTVCILAASLFISPIFLWPIAIVLGIGLNGTSSVLYATVARFIPANLRPRYYGYFYTTNEIGTIGAPLLYGFIADLMGLRSSILIMSVVTSAILPSSLALKKHVT
jgi:FSR family fosmidomycin resistance protein-like MFS transporter